MRMVRLSKFGAFAAALAALLATVLFAQRLRQGPSRPRRSATRAAILRLDQDFHRRGPADLHDQGPGREEGLDRQGNLREARQDELALRRAQREPRRSDGSTIKIYEKEAEQVYELPVEKSQYPAALSFLMGKGQLTKIFCCAGSTAQDEIRRRLRPRRHAQGGDARVPEGDALRRLGDQPGSARAHPRRAGESEPVRLHGAVVNHPVARVSSTFYGAARGAGRVMSRPLV